MPFLWNKLYGRVLSRRGDLAPYQNAQAEKIKQDSESFHEEVRSTDTFISDILET